MHHRLSLPAGAIGLNVMEEMRDRYESFVGLSDHSGTMFPATRRQPRLA